MPAPRAARHRIDASGRCASRECWILRTPQASALTAQGRRGRPQTAALPVSPIAFRRSVAGPAAATDIAVGAARRQGRLAVVRFRTLSAARHPSLVAVVPRRPGREELLLSGRHHRRPAGVSPKPPMPRPRPPRRRSDLCPMPRIFEPGAPPIPSTAPVRTVFASNAGSRHGRGDRTAGVCPPQAAAPNQPMPGLHHGHDLFERARRIVGPRRTSLVIALRPALRRPPVRGDARPPRGARCRRGDPSLRGSRNERIGRVTCPIPDAA